MNAAAKAKEALEALADNAKWEQDRRLQLEMVLEHLIQAAGDRKAQMERRQEVEALASSYRKVVAEAGEDPNGKLDLSPGLAERYGVNG